jgi:hypothetical protein
MAHPASAPDPFAGLTLSDENLAKGRAALDAAAGSDPDPGLVDRLTAELADDDPLRLGIRVLRDLLAVESRPDRFDRLLRLWEARVLGAVRSGDFTAADIWLRAVVSGPAHPPEFDDRVRGAFDELSRPEVLDELVVALAGAEDTAGGPSLLAAWGERVVSHLIERMTVEDPPVARRHLVDFVAWAARGDVRLLAAHLKDPRWYVARNVAVALGRTGRVTAVPALEHLLGHRDDRVRIEALRALVAVERDGIVERAVAALADPAERVRKAAISLLRANPDPSVVAAVVGVLERQAIDAESSRRLVALIAERKGDDVGPALLRLTSRRTGKPVREAARAALTARGAA